MSYSGDRGGAGSRLKLFSVRINVDSISSHCYFNARVVFPLAHFGKDPGPLVPSNYLGTAVVNPHCTRACGTHLHPGPKSRPTNLSFASSNSLVICSFTRQRSSSNSAALCWRSARISSVARTRRAILHAELDTGVWCKTEETHRRTHPHKTVVAGTCRQLQG